MWRKSNGIVPVVKDDELGFEHDIPKDLNRCACTVPLH
jgi:hypothetical protein